MEKMCHLFKLIAMNEKQPDEMVHFLKELIAENCPDLCECYFKAIYYLVEVGNKPPTEFSPGALLALCEAFRDLLTLRYTCWTRASVDRVNACKQNLVKWCRNVLVQECLHARFETALVSILAIDLFNDQDLFDLAVMRLVSCSTEAWDMMLPTILADRRLQFLDENSPKFESLLFSHSIQKYKMERRLRIYELKLFNTDLTWDSFSKDLKLCGGSRDKDLEYAILSQIFSELLAEKGVSVDAERIGRKMFETRIGTFLSGKAQQGNREALRLLSSMPQQVWYAMERAEKQSQEKSSISSRQSEEKSEAQTEFEQMLLDFLKCGQDSDLIVYDCLIRRGTSFKTDEDIRKRVSKLVHHTKSENKRNGVLVSSLVLEQYSKAEAASICKEVHKMAKTPFLDYRLTAHRFFHRVAGTEAGVIVIYEGIPNFTGYLADMSTEHEMDGFRSKWNLISHFATSVTSSIMSSQERTTLQTIVSKGLPVYMTGPKHQRVEVATESAQ